MGLLETALEVPGWGAQAAQLGDGAWALEIIGQFGLPSESLNTTLRQTFLNLYYSLCQDPLAACQGP